LTDANGCTDVITAPIVQIDAELPVALCQDVLVQLNASGSATLSAAVVNNGSSDNCGIASLVVSPNVFSCAEVGLNNVTLTVTDVNGNVATCNATVTVQDTVAPIAVCQDLTVTLDGSGNASILASQIDNGSSDNCTVQSITLSPNNFTCAQLGPTQVTLTVTDVGGNVSTCDATVTVLEDTDPIAVCQDVTVQLDATGNVSVTGNQIGGGSTDNCGVVDISVAPADFTCADVGDNPVMVTVTDANGNSSTCSATVSVEDLMAPDAVCQDINVFLDASGNATISASDVDGGSTDNCGIDNISATPTSFTCADAGPNAVQLTVVDVNGNTSNCTSIVTVLDTVAPTAVCQDITVQLDANGMANVTAAQIDNGSTDNCGSVSVSISPNSFDCTVTIPGQVELTVTDGSGNASTCSATVTLEETTPPTALCQDITVQLDGTGSVSIVGVDVDGGSTDNCGVADLTLDISSFDCSNAGANTVTLTVSDTNGNSSACTATVTVAETVPPVAVCQDITVQLDATGSFTISAADVDGGSSDNCLVDSLSVTPASFDCGNLGTETVTLSVFDAYGNSNTCTADVTVLDTVPPTAICQDITVQLDALGNASIVASQVDNGSTDVCGIAGISLDNTVFDCSALGAVNVELTVLDNSGNSSTCTATVAVEDNVAPIAVCQNLTVYLDASGTITADPLSANGGSTDNCGVASLSLSQTDFLCSDLGQEIVTLTVEDASGNTDDCIAVITVLDTISPIIVGCPNDTLIEPNSNDCSPVVTWPEPTVSDNCTATLSSNFSSGDSFPVGTTTVVYDAEDESGNTASCSFDVTIQPSEIIVDITSPTFACGYNISCNGADDGVAVASVSGGCEPYSLFWSNGQIAQTAVGLSAGEHVLIVADANGTQATDTIVLTEPQPLVTDSISSPKFEGGVNVSCNGFSDASISLSIGGGADCQPYGYSWIGPNGFAASTDDLIDLESGNYVVTVTDANGCVLVDSILLTEPEPLELQAFPTTYNGFNISCFGSDNGFINLEVSGGTANYQYDWSNGETEQDIDSLTVGTYDVLVTDTNGCAATISITLTEPSQLVVIPTDTVLVACNGNSNGQFQVQASGGVPAYSYNWSNGDVDPILNGVGVGVYQVVVTDLNGCQDSLELEMTEPSAVVVAVDQITDATCFGYNDGSATVSASGGVGPYNYNWLPSGQSSATASGLTAGDHFYTVTDANGCSNSDTLQVGEPDQILILTSNDTTVCPGTLVPLTASVSGGGGTYLINWGSGQGFGENFQINITQTSNVSVTATDQFGCQAVPNSVIVTTYAPVNAAFDYAVIDPCTVPFQVDFTNSSTNASSFDWTFANGDSSTQFLPSTMFDSSGVYSVQLVATSDDGCTDTLNSSIAIDNLPQAMFAIPYPDGCFPIVVGHYNQSQDANTYFWDFGDGQTSEEASPYHLYEDPGAYTVSLIATNENGCMDTLTVDSAVFAFPRPTAGFFPVQTITESGSEYMFTNTSTGATEYFWTFGNGDFSQLFEPIYQYPEHGNYDILLTAYNQYGCEDTAEYSIYVDLLAHLYVPNAMAPEEWGDQGLFLPKGTGLLEYHVWVFDLWGNQLWESTALTNGSPAEGWDGRYKGELVPQGAYSWKINARFKNGVIWDGVEQVDGTPKNVGSVTVLY
ncbi:MAG: HYR domain-containing protein, partial [Flavobacteriales bacterium]|nr:HYR domain-containing protein [Flavobacteriales bacterium]